jgi:hypothetical protein
MEHPPRDNWFRTILNKGRLFLFGSFGKLTGRAVRAVDPCPFGCKDLLGNPRMFLGCHLPIRAIFQAESGPQRGGVFHPVKPVKKYTGDPKHYFYTKGKDAENYIHALASETCFADWCYQNPKRPNGKELCDLLVVFGDTAIIIQVKNVKTDKKTGGFKTSDIEKNHSQLIGAHRQLAQLKTILHLQNSRRGEESFNPREIQKFHLVSIMLGPAQKRINLTEICNGEKIHVFLGDFFETLLNELDTIKDLFKYLKDREKLFESNVIVQCESDEKGLLAGYIVEGYSFDFLEPGVPINFRKSVWKNYVKSNPYRTKKDLDRLSYLWDEMIANLHTGQVISDDNITYERLARVMAATSRNERRGLVSSFLRGIAEATSSTKMYDTQSRTVNDRINKVTYCFFYYADSEDGRRNLDEMFDYCCACARNTFPNTMVVGIACCPNSMEYSFGWRFKMFEQEELSAEASRMLKEHAVRVGVIDGGMKTYAERILPDFRKNRK